MTLLSIYCGLGAVLGTQGVVLSYYYLPWEGGL